MNPSNPTRSQRAATFTLVALFMAANFMLVNERLDSLNAAMNEANSASRAMTELDVERTTLANDIRFHAEQSEVNLAVLPFTNDKAKRVPVYAEMDKHNAALDQAIGRITPLLTSASEKELLARLIKSRETFRNNLQETVDALELDDREKAVTLLTTSTQDNLQEIRSLVAHLVKGQKDSMTAQKKEDAERKTEADSALSRSRLIVIGLGLGAALVGLMLGLVLARRTV